MELADIFQTLSNRVKIKTMKTIYKNSKDFAKAMGLSEVEIALIREKKKLIEKLKDKRKSNSI